MHFLRFFSKKDFREKVILPWHGLSLRLNQSRCSDEVLRSESVTVTDIGHHWDLQPAAVTFAVAAAHYQLLSQSLVRTTCHVAPQLQSADGQQRLETCWARTHLKIIQDSGATRVRNENGRNSF